MNSAQSPGISPTEAAKASAQAIHDLGATFMLDAQTYMSAASAGYEKTAFYFGGRGGVLGEVTAEEVAVAFMFFPLETTRVSWEAAARVESRTDSAVRFAQASHDWARAHLPEGAVDYERLAELAGKVVEAADGSEAPVFAGWRSLPEPSDPRELALHRINALRELRFARHGAAVRSVELEPVEAFMIKTPYMAPIFGWPTPESDPSEQARSLWERAEELTNEAFGQDLAALTPEELAEFCDLVNTTLNAAV